MCSDLTNNLAPHSLYYLTQIFTELTQLNLIDRLRKQIFEQLQAQA